MKYLHYFYLLFKNPRLLLLKQVLISDGSHFQQQVVISAEGLGFIRVAFGGVWFSFVSPTCVHGFI